MKAKVDTDEEIDSEFEKRHVHVWRIWGVTPPRFGSVMADVTLRCACSKKHQQKVDICHPMLRVKDKELVPDDPS
jgi:hypothetical protein